MDTSNSLYWRCLTALNLKGRRIAYRQVYSSASSSKLFPNVSLSFSVSLSQCEGVSINGHVCNSKISDSSFFTDHSLCSKCRMHPTSSMAFEPALERGVPWGRDLFTFVTSAAGHMMRTLQRPRKNKPSKRQVNHRRFLHNMIQRKFAEIEAANQQLASALFSADTSQSQSDLKFSHKTEAKNRKTATMTSSETETPTKQQDEANERKTLHSAVVNHDISFLKNQALSHPNSQPWEGVEEFEPSQENSSQQTADFSYDTEQIQSTAVDMDNLSQVTNIILEDSVFTWLESIERIRQNSDAHSPKSNDVEQQCLGITLFDMLPTSPAVSPLSLDSCDFEEQMQPDSDHSSEVQHITESLQMDVMENPELLDFSGGYLQSQFNDHRNVASVWNTQNEEGQNCFQDTLRFPNVPHEGYVLGDLTDCADEGTTGGLEAGPQASMLLESSVRDVNAEYIACTFAPCRPTCHQNQTRNAARQTGLTKDCYVSEPDTDIITTISKEGQYSASCSWSISDRSLKGMELSNISNNSLDNQVPQRLEHVHTNQSLTKYWDQHHGHKVTDPYHVLVDADKNIVQTEVTLDPNSVYASPPNPLSSSTHCYGYDVPTQANGNCRGGSCLYSNEGDGSIPSFEGVAQSFPVPVHKPHPHPISALPLNDDWLFSNIVAEEDFNGIAISPEVTYC